MNVWPLPCISFRELSSVKESRPTALITEPAWTTARAPLTLSTLVQAEPTSYDPEFAEYLAATLPSAVEVIYALGDDKILNMAKLVAHKSSKPLVIVPVMISSDQPFTPQASFKEDGKWQTVTTGPASEVIIDMEVIGSAPAHHRAAGIVDVLSIVTGLMDWGYAHQKNKTTAETQFIPWAAGVAAGLASQALKSAGAIGKGEPEALRTLVELLCLTVQLDNLLGHRRASQGSEHIFADAVITNVTVVDVSHAERVAPGILLTAALHKKDSVGLRKALESAGIRLTQLKREDIRTAFNALPEYVRANATPFGILNDLQPDSEEMQQALERSTLMSDEASSA